MLFKNNKPAYQITLYTSMTLWLLSLCLPAVGRYQQFYWGYELFINGIGLGFLLLIAVPHLKTLLEMLPPYANVIYLGVFVLLLNKKSCVTLALICVIISLTSFLHKLDYPVYHWGLVCWFVSFFLVTLACLQYKINPESRFNSIPYVVGLFVVLIGLSQYQYRHANSEERRLYYTKPLVAFVDKKFIDFPYQPMDNVVFKHGDLIEFSNGKIDKYFQRFENTDKYSLELPQYYVYQGKVYLRQNFGYRFAKPLGEQKPNYKIEYYTDKGLTGLKVVNQNQQMIWQGLFKPNNSESWAYQKPDYMERLKEKFYKLNDYDSKTPNFEKMEFTKVNFSQTQDYLSVIYHLNTTPIPYEIYQNDKNEKVPVIAVYQSGDFVLYFARQTYANQETYLKGFLIDTKNWNVVTYLDYTKDSEKDLISDKWDTLFLTSTNKPNLSEKIYTISNNFAESKTEKE